MDVLPSEEEQMVKNLAREFLTAECPPRLARDMEQDEQGYPPELWNKMAQLGWFGMSIPEAYDGQGLPLTYLALILEEVGRAIAPVPFHSTVVPALTIARDGSEGQRQEVLPRVSQGSLIMTWAFQEPDPRLLPEAVNTQAVADGDHYVINGTKMFVDNFNVAEKCLVACRTAPASADNQGISMFLVNTDTPGIAHTPLVTLAKDKQSKVEFQQVRIPRANLVGGLHQGWPVAQTMLDRATVLLCAQMVGAARKDIEMAIDYAKNRVAFGRPIGAFQSV
ncbi:MAG TPA: acyl-CoA dehydrogenase family protein, partial [Dehalococcoidia bacterium]|nr:acyl-CoA dehydrogenase family protein [Dehalococcoidia bacterium]